MMQTLNPYTATTTAKTAEIMARYRPIAPKPDVPVSPTGSGGEGDQNPSSMSPSIQQSPYLRNVWPHLQARPTRTRKRGRTSLAPSPSVKRSRTCLQDLSPPYQVTTTTNSPAANSLSLQGFAHCPSGLIPQLCPLSSLATLNVPGLEGQTLVTLPLLPCPSTLPMEATNILDFNNSVQIPEEKDLLAQLQGQAASTTAVISPRPIRPVGSSINVWSINENDSRSTHAQQIIQQKAEEVEEEVESEPLPAFVSDSNNRVRLVNSAYKEMVGQPECPWLDSMVTANEGGVACKRICGEVTLRFADPENVLVSSNGFSCRVRIEWGRNGEKVIANAFCEVAKLICESKDYLFAWRLHVKEASDL